MESYSIIARMNTPVFNADLQRLLLAQVQSELSEAPAVVLLGPRQVGKTTLALQIAAQQPSVYLDLQSAADRARLGEPELSLPQWQDKLVILDEVQRAPDLFASLRGLIDTARRSGRKTGLYLLLGSASLDLLRQSGESLAGRVAYLDLAPLTTLETGLAAQETLWLRGGFPESYTARSDTSSLRWRNNFVQTYLERDVPQLGSRIPAQTLQRFWTMLCHHQGGLLNVAQLARNMMVDGKTALGYIDLLCDLLLVRRLPPWHTNTGKRLVKSPKVYVRDSGLVHALLSIQHAQQLLAHPVVGASWEGFVIENLIASAPRGSTAHFYRTGAGAEVDLLLSLPSGQLWAIEIKRSLAPKLDRGFHEACTDLNPDKKWVVYAGQDTFVMRGDIQVVSLHELCALLQQELR
jgi:uncharacterized protein